MPVTATIGGTTVAKADTWQEVEGNYYFPPSALDTSYFTKSSTETFCPWKGTASYYNINVNGNQVKDGAWYYPNTGDKAKHIEGFVAFYKGKVDVAQT